LKSRDRATGHLGILERMERAVSRRLFLTARGLCAVDDKGMVVGCARWGLVEVNGEPVPVLIAGFALRRSHVGGRPTIELSEPATIAA
jgi:hypothetical protein